MNDATPDSGTQMSEGGLWCEPVSSAIAPEELGRGARHVR